MKTMPTKEEAEVDLDWTRQDIRRLEAIVKNLEEFIQFAHGEDRSRYKLDLMKWQTILADGRSVEGKIERHLRVFRKS